MLVNISIGAVCKLYVNIHLTQSFVIIFLAHQYYFYKKNIINDNIFS